jgi:hypothetical protein
MKEMKTLNLTHESQVELIGKPKETPLFEGGANEPICAAIFELKDLDKLER